MFRWQAYILHVPLQSLPVLPEIRPPEVKKKKTRTDLNGIDSTEYKINNTLA